MSFTIEGTNSMPPISGGYLIINLDGNEFHIVSVPSPVLYATRPQDSIAENYVTLKDNEGDAFSISVWSSNGGVDWKIEVKASDVINEEVLRTRIAVEYQANDF